jgi:site-specific recombinase XerD
MSSVKNELLQRYVSSKPNHVICVDISFLTKTKCYFIGVDLATRVVVGHFFKASAVQVDDVVKYLDKVLGVRSFVNEVEIVHSDRESLFSNDRYYDFLKSRNVRVSRGSSKGYNNQVVERLHRTIKFNLKKALITNKDLALDRKNFCFSSVSESIIKTELNRVIEEYNNKPHDHNYGLSPNNMDEAFHSAKQKNTLVASVPSLVKNNDSETSVALMSVRKQVASVYANNWEQFFLDWRKDQAIKDERLFKENLMLRKELSAVHKTLNYVADETKINEIARNKRELSKQKRSMSVKLPLRDVVSKDEFNTVLSLIESNSFSDCRRRLALVVLYLTGLRVSNLRVLTVRHFKMLFRTGKTIIPLIKNGADRHSIELSLEGQKLLNQYKVIFNILCKNKCIGDPVFSSAKNPSTCISREVFDRELNSILTKASSLFGKHLRTHSFRATLITDLLISTPIDVVKEFIGHRDIKSTLTYKRSRLTEDAIKKVLCNLDKTRVLEKEKKDK